MNNPVQNAISYGLRSLCYGEGKNAHHREAYIAGRDVLMVAPTGSGKRLIFQIAPFVFDHFKYGKRKNIKSIWLLPRFYH